MSTATPGATIEVHLGEGELRAALEHDAREGLGATPKRLPPVYFYDERGCALFEEITQLPEYYPTRAERLLLQTHAAAIASGAKASTLVELGAGSCDKSRILLDALCDAGTLERYVPLDVSESTLSAAADSLVSQYPGLAVQAVVGDFHRHLGHLPDGGRRMVAFLGGTIGNLEPQARARFLFDLDCVLAPGDTLLLGTDLVKDPARLVAAYDDPGGVTAAFNRNVLDVLNRELEATFEPEAFEHVALWDAEQRWIEMRLRASKAMAVQLDALGMEVHFSAGEELRTEVSAKFTRETVEAELWEAGFVVEGMWDEPGGEFLLTLATPYC